MQGLFEAQSNSEKGEIQDKFHTKASHIPNFQKLNYVVTWPKKQELSVILRSYCG
jgi:hypothetical protein